MDKKILKPFIDITFWNHLRELKIEKTKLSTDPITIKSYIKDIIDDNLLIDLNNASFNEDNTIISAYLNYSIKGNLIIFNKIEELTEENIKTYIDKYNTNDIYFNLFVFFNFKNYDINYWFVEKCYSNINITIDKNINIIEESKQFLLFTESICRDNDIQYCLQDIFLGGNFTYDKHNKCIYIYENINNNMINNLTISTINFIINNYKAIDNSISDPIKELKYIIIQERLLNFEISKDFLFKKILKINIINKDIKTDLFIFKDFLNVSSFLSPEKISINQNKMHLNLMKWRNEPNIEPDYFTNLKILILGCGTLGCAVIRNLIAWNITNFILIDNSNISYSNPNRQCLFNFKDAKLSKSKAECAAKKILKINPNANVEYYNINILLPGHFSKVTDKEIKEFNILKECISKCDVAFNLLDTKEGRYLPSLIERMYNKIAISVGLGFDSFSIIRHSFVYGNNNEFDNSGCFFCADSIAPSNTVKDRTFDQQCTVTRPGLSFVSSGYAVELLINLIQKMNNKEIGPVPSYLRGTAGSFKVENFISERSDICMACGSDIIKEFKQNEIKFLEKIAEDTKYIDKIAFKEAFNDDSSIDYDEF